MHKAAPSLVDHQRLRQGVICGVLSYGLWGLIPLYFKALSGIAPTEVLAQRVLWSFVSLGALVWMLGRWRDLRTAFTSRHILLPLTASTLLLALNWFTYIYAVTTNQVVEASLGYFLNPLVNVLLGFVFLKETLRPWQIASIVLAGIGVSILGAPLIAVTLAVSFAFYGLLRKTVAVEGMLGLLIETVLLLPLAALYVGWLQWRGESAFVTSDPSACVKLAASGIVTVAPLLLFTAAARRLRFSTLGFLQYLAPTIQFIIAVALFDEPLSSEKIIAMTCIWTAVAVYSIDSLRLYRSQRVAFDAMKPAAADL
jgi:chloramphenicol-sensitive protein RarD